MKKIVGYLIAIVGLVITIASFNLSLLKITLPSSIKSSYIMIFGICLVILGVVLSLSKSSGRGRQIENEVPIYHKDKIVGYRKESHK